MRIEGSAGRWVIARDWTPPRYFCFLVDSDRACWSRSQTRATFFDVRAVAEHNLVVLRARAKVVRESHPGFLGGVPHKPKPLAEYVWSRANKKLLVQMFTIGCKPEAMAVQFGRTAAACRAMYALMQKRGTI